MVNGSFFSGAVGMVTRSRREELSHVQSVD